MVLHVRLGYFGKKIGGTKVTAFFVRGRPVPQGSLKFIHGKPIHARASDLAVWRADIARNAQLSGFSAVSGAVQVSADFIFKRPKSTPNRAFPYVKPDLDKLIRAVLDGLTGVAYEDDCQVIIIQTTKRYGDQEGVWISIKQVGL